MTTKQASAVRQHGENLLAIFTNATERDPIKLCKRLRRLENQGQALALRLCNGPEFESYDEVDAIQSKIMDRVYALLRPASVGVRLKFNRDPRGYALKISDKDAKDMIIHKDWGGYGILAPDLT